MAPFDYMVVRERVERVLRDAFGPNATVVTDEGWHGRVHAKIVSPAFDGLSEERKQARVWDVLRQEMGEDVQAVSLVLAYGADEI